MVLLESSEGFFVPAILSEVCKPRICDRLICADYIPEAAPDPDIVVSKGSVSNDNTGGEGSGLGDVGNKVFAYDDVAQGGAFVIKQFHPGKEQIGVKNVRTACGTDLNTQVRPIMFWSVWRRDILMGWSHSIRSTIAVLVSGKTLNMRCFLVCSCMITDSKMLMQDVRSRLKVK